MIADQPGDFGLYYEMDAVGRGHGRRDAVDQLSGYPAGRGIRAFAADDHG